MAGGGGTGAGGTAIGGTQADVIVVGGGMVGTAIAYGLARRGISTLILDEGDRAFRAARGNFGLVWIQTKGLGMQRYQEWSRESAHLYADFAAELREGTGVDICHRKPGGLILCLGGADYARQAEVNAAMARQAGNAGYHAEMIDRQTVQALLPRLRLGDEVVGGSYSPEDGHVGPLFLLRAMHEGFARAGGRWLPETRAESIRRDGAGFAVETPAGTFRAGKVVLAAGHGIPRLAAMVGLDVPTRPERGQILVTERTEPLFPMPVHSIRQTAEGSILIGNTNEAVGFDDGTTLSASRNLAHEAIRALPDLARLRLVRTWGAIRVLPPDKFPIYDESESHPGAYVATNHSGVTLAAVHARHLSAWIAEGIRPAGFEAFSARRFAGVSDVSTAA